MAATYFAVNREGGAALQSLANGVANVSVSTATQAGYDMELRVNTTDANGHNLTKKDVVTALVKIRAFLMTNLATTPVL